MCGHNHTPRHVWDFWPRTGCPPRSWAWLTYQGQLLDYVLECSAKKYSVDGFHYKHARTGGLHLTPVIYLHTASPTEASKDPLRGSLQGSPHRRRGGAFTAGL